MKQLQAIVCSLKFTENINIIIVNVNIKTERKQLLLPLTYTFHSLNLFKSIPLIKPGKKLPITVKIL